MEFNGGFDNSGGYGGDMEGGYKGKGKSKGYKGKGKGKSDGKGKGKGFRKGKGGGKSELYYGGDDTGDRIRPKATETEAKEARAIVVKAQISADERKADLNAGRSKVATATQDDLQAMINARLAKTP
mmetsp:Transcript_14070/g.24755  ORF Transcript_14070/g.24755 Transcript_14070/m.24755 type:complete len:127 (+) Transcript_14070:122-502(+)|eukprot:CAMPEP_0197651138 /NCGR_PEP_ID=MMETSP1338-20131121/31375_1 /TAXON_ID=43686 ORGANISM="Pelagodinium beii, Strain RCC1491" /NCGR_SAMPLE_ID=MMETSP1338 /ASSEMBLY_ACC=CAM_ASM_000754 /LENGTH=126 /DNA_ID=CAMNT_0043225701 /DNA_START=117 /DNA_END=497 /DNA_ORIENTATION=+